MSQNVVITTEIVAELRQSLPHLSVVTPESPRYADSIVRWSKAAEKPAGLIIYPASAEEVSSAILFCRTHSLEIAVCGGRHSSSGASSSDGGVVIDLANMRRVIVNATNKTVRVQGGAVWKDVDEALGEHGLAAVGGTVNHTGVGGLTLGGGIGWLTGKYGYTIDNLLSAVIVLANGHITTASESENPDLFWAIRGAGAAFGIAAEFVFRAHEQKELVWGGSLGFPDTKHLEEILEFANNFAETTDGAAGMGVVGPSEFGGLLVVILHFGAEDAGKAIFRPLLELEPPVNTTCTRPYSTVNSMLNSAAEYGTRRSSRGPSFNTPISASFVRQILSRVQALHQKIPDAKRTSVLFEFFGTEQTSNVPQTSMAFANRGKHQNFSIMCNWTDEAKDKAVRDWARELAGIVEGEFAATKRGDAAASGQYTNYDQLASDARKVFGVNYKRLVELKKRYDPENVFCKSYNLLS